MQNFAPMNEQCVKSFKKNRKDFTLTVLFWLLIVVKGK